jgi:hypothetical protein
MYFFFNLGAGWMCVATLYLWERDLVTTVAYRRLDGPHSRSGRVQKISPLLGFGPRTVQPVAGRYTDYAIPVHSGIIIIIKI